MKTIEKLELPPSDNPRRKQWEGSFNGTQESLDWINSMTEACDDLYYREQEWIRSLGRKWVMDKDTSNARNS